MVRFFAPPKGKLALSLKPGKQNSQAASTNEAAMAGSIDRNHVDTNKHLSGGLIHLHFLLHGLAVRGCSLTNICCRNGWLSELLVMGGIDLIVLWALRWEWQGSGLVRGPQILRALRWDLAPRPTQ